MLFLLYGLAGLLVECLFTGLRNLLRRRWFATSTTYLWMVPVYGLAGLCMHGLTPVLADSPLLRAVLFTLLVYVVEFYSGLVLAVVTVVLREVLGGSQVGVPWRYDDSPWAPWGIVNLLFAPYWFALAVAFPYLDAWIVRIANG